MANKKYDDRSNEGKVLIFRPYYHKPDGTVVYPKNGGVFPMWVSPEEARRR